MTSPGRRPRVPVRLVLVVADVRFVGVVAGAVAVAGGVLMLRSSRQLGPVPAGEPSDATETTARDAIALGGAAPG